MNKETVKRLGFGLVAVGIISLGSTVKNVVEAPTNMAKIEVEVQEQFPEFNRKEFQQKFEKHFTEKIVFNKGEKAFNEEANKHIVLPILTFLGGFTSLSLGGILLTNRDRRIQKQKTIEQNPKPSI